VACFRYLVVFHKELWGGGIDVRIPPPTLIVCLWFYTLNTMKISRT
jgi:hypothetical protein